MAALKAPSSLSEAAGLSTACPFGYPSFEDGPPSPRDAVSSLPPR